MDYRLNFFIILVTMGMFFSEASAVEWRKVKESDGIKSYTKVVSESKYQAVKAVGIVDAPVPVIESILRDPPAYTEFVLNCREYALVNTSEFENLVDTYHIYMVTAMPFPLKERDAVCRNEFTIEKNTGTIHVCIYGIKTNYKLINNKVRIPLIKVEYILTPKSANQTEVIYTTVLDPGGVVPEYISNIFSKNMGIDIIKGLRNMVRIKKYKDRKIVLTTTPHLENSH